MIDIQTLRPDQLTAEHQQAWRQMLTREGGLGSPFFDPAYVQIVGEHRTQTEVGVVCDSGTPVAFFPYERHQGTIAKPLGIKLCDFQGIIAREDHNVEVGKILRGCRLTTWDFDHRLTSTPARKCTTCVTHDSPYLDLSQGFKTYATERKQGGSALLSQTQRKQRKLERELGPLRFEWHTTEEAVFDQLLKWKQAQRERTHTFDVLQFDWVVDLLKSVWRTQSGPFNGVLSALYVQDRLAAAHLGMHTPTVLHHWFTTYDRDLSKYSPGLILLLETANGAAERGIQRLDLGKGDEPYKASFASGALTIDEGVTELRPVRALLQSASLRTREWIKSSPLYGPAQLPKRWIRKFRFQAAMQ